MRDRLLNCAIPDVISAIRAGDREMFTKMFNAYWVPLVEWAYYHVRNQADAEETVARVLGNVWVGREQWNVRTTVEAYLFGAVHQEVRRTWRDARRREVLTERVARLDGGATIGTTSTSPDQPVLDAERSKALQAAVAALPERYRLAIGLRWERQMSYDEIAQVLDISNGAARVLVTRALGLLRERFDLGVV